MRKLWIAVPALLISTACFDLDLGLGTGSCLMDCSSGGGGWGATGPNIMLPPERDPGEKLSIQIAMFSGKSGWTPNGRFVIPVRAATPNGNPSVAVVSYDPATLAADTLGSVPGSFVHQLRIAATSGTAYVSTTKVNAPGWEIYRLTAGQSPATVSASVSLSDGVFLISDDESRMLAHVESVPGMTAIDLKSGTRIGHANVYSPLAARADLGEVLQEYPLSIVPISGDASRLINLGSVGGQIVDAAWINGTLRLLVMHMSFSSGQPLQTLSEWDEATKTLTQIGTLPASSVYGLPPCIAWSPATHSAIAIVDSLNNGVAVVNYKAHWSILSVAGGQTTNLGSVNVEIVAPKDCSLSRDGRTLTYRLGENALYVKSL